MTLSFSAADQARFTAALQTLLSPLNFPDSPTWAAAAGEAVRGLFSADSGMVILPGLTFIEGPGLPDTIRRAYNHLYEGALRGQRTEDPLAMEFVRRRREAGVDAVDFDSVNRLLGGRILQSQFHQDAFVAGGVRDMHALYADAVVGGRPAEIALVAFFERPVRGDHGAQGLAVLRTLKPVFQSGVEMSLRLGMQRAALASALDGIGSALAVVALPGRTLHRTPALTSLLENEPERERLGEAVRATSLAVAWTHTSNRPETLPSPALVVTTAGSRYQVRATAVGEGVFESDPVALVLVERATASPLSDVTLRDRYGLTRQEVRVAWLLAERRTNKEIADSLFVSLSTARHHAEHVLEKLGVHSRNGVAAMLKSAD